MSSQQTAPNPVHNPTAPATEPAAPISRENPTTGYDPARYEQPPPFDPAQFAGWIEFAEGHAPDSQDTRPEILLHVRCLHCAIGASIPLTVSATRVTALGYLRRHKTCRPVERPAAPPSTTPNHEVMRALFRRWLRTHPEAQLTALAAWTAGYAAAQDPASVERLERVQEQQQPLSKGGAL